MVTFNKKTVNVSVDRDFFDFLFEPSRKSTQKKFGLDRLTQKDFTKMMFKSNMKFDIPLRSLLTPNEIAKTRKRKKR